MIFSNDRDTLRAQYLNAWNKAGAGEALSPLEQQIASVVSEHPEYHPMLENRDRALGADYQPEGGETNPFLHMGMHLALREQLSTDRPTGFRSLYQAISGKLGDAHEAEHRIMECLGEALWRAQRNGTPPNEQDYLECLRALAGQS
ncbi:MAG: DUF1841 family protein [Gammaproteobacteria bacterium]